MTLRCAFLAHLLRFPFLTFYLSFSLSFSFYVPMSSITLRTVFPDMHQRSSECRRVCANTLRARNLLRLSWCPTRRTSFILSQNFFHFPPCFQSLEAPLSFPNKNNHNIIRAKYYFLFSSDRTRSSRCLTFLFCSSFSATCPVRTLRLIFSFFSFSETFTA